MTILFMTGFARAGKTTVINELSKLGVMPLSTSHYLSKKTIEYYYLVPRESYGFPGYQQKMDRLHEFWMEVLKNKEDDVFKRATGTTCREAKIHVAENVIVPNLGRLEGLVKPTISTSPYFDHAICEVFNLEELECWKQGFEDLGYNEEEFDYIALRSERELTGVDGRELFGDNVFNDGNLSDTVNYLLDRIKS